LAEVFRRAEEDKLKHVPHCLSSTSKLMWGRCSECRRLQYCSNLIEILLGQFRIRDRGFAPGLAGFVFPAGGSKGVAKVQ